MIYCVSAGPSGIEDSGVQQGVWEPSAKAEVEPDDAKYRIREISVGCPLFGNGPLLAGSTPDRRYRSLPVDAN
jgi:hypothetical protein